MFICTFFTSLGTFCLKKASANLSFSIDIITNYWIYIGAFLYLTGAVVMIIALKGGDLSVLYPIMATAYIWIMLFSILLLRENVSLMQWTGLGLIVAGIGLNGTKNSSLKKRRGKINYGN